MTTQAPREMVERLAALLELEEQPDGAPCDFPSYATGFVDGLRLALRELAP